MSFRTKTTIFAFSAALLVTAGCQEGFDPFNKVDKLRVLAIQAQPPAVLAGEQSELSALVYVPDDAPMSYRWSWCPVTLGAVAGYECAVDEQELKEAMDDALPGSSALLPSFDLGSESTASLALNIPPQAIEALCDEDFQIPNFDVSQFFSCDGDLVVNIKLEVETASEKVTAVKDLVLLTEDNPDKNINPTIGQVAIDGDSQQILAEGESTSLGFATWYDFRVTVPSFAAQTFTSEADEEDPDPSPERESLFMTWFVTGGKTDSQRTTYIEDEVPFDTLETNSWKTPFAKDAPSGEARLFLVLQDERGGVTWTTRSIELLEK